MSIAYLEYGSSNSQEINWFYLEYNYMVIFGTLHFDVTRLRYKGSFKRSLRMHPWHWGLKALMLKGYELSVFVLFSMDVIADLNFFLCPS